MTKYVYQGHFWDGDRLYLGQESSCLLWKAKFHCGDPRKKKLSLTHLDTSKFTLPTHPIQNPPPTCIFRAGSSAKIFWAYNNIYVLQLGCYPVAVVILHVYKTWNWLLINLSQKGYKRSM